MRACSGCEFYCHGHGECRRNPPAHDPNFPARAGAWPVVKENSWCGEFKKEEEHSK